MFSRHRVRNIILALSGLVVIGVTGCLVFIILLANALNGIGDSLNNPQCAPSNPAGIEAIAQFRLPPSAKLLASNCGGLQGWVAWAKFEMSPSDLDTFLATTHTKPPLSSTNRPQQLRCHFTDGQDIPDYLYGGYSGFKWEEEVFIDTHDRSRYIVYFTVLGG